MPKITLPSPSQAKKAIFAGATALVGSITTALADGSLTTPEIIVAVLTGLTAAVGTFQIENAPME